MPNITGKFGYVTDGHAFGVFQKGDYVTNWFTGTGGFAQYYVNMDASHSSSTYQDNAHVRPFSMTVAFFIRY